MLAIDTNILIRFIAKDDPDQAERARTLFAREVVFIPTTVLLESDWVLRRGVGLSREQALQALVGVVGLPNVKLQDVAVARKALDWAFDGMDFADALHLATTYECEAFITFDKRMKKLANRLGQPVREP